MKIHLKFWKTVKITNFPQIKVRFGNDRRERRENSDFKILRVQHEMFFITPTLLKTLVQSFSYDSYIFD